MTEETWEQKYERERKEEAIKAAKLFAAYKADPKKKLISKEYDRHGKQTDYVYDEGTVETDAHVKVKTTTFTVQGKKVRMHKRTETRQKFLVVSGPKTGQRITNTDPKYALYNRNSVYSNPVDIPNCVLVHIDSFVDD